MTTDTALSVEKIDRPVLPIHHARFAVRHWPFAIPIRSWKNKERPVRASHDHRKLFRDAKNPWHGWALPDAWITHAGRFEHSLLVWRLLY